MNLPIELLQQTLGLLSPRDLARCARVNRVIGESALALLYRDIDLSRFHEPLYEELEKDRRQQRNLLSTIAKRPDVGRYVQSFRNATDTLYSRSARDVTEENDNVLSLVSAAKNMTMLHRAILTRNLLSSSILESITSYPHLRDLSLHGVIPATCHWENTVLPLRSLTWELPSTHEVRQPFTAVISILEAALGACPELMSLDVLIGQELAPELVPDDVPYLESPSQLASLVLTRKRLLNLQQLALKGSLTGFKDDDYNSSFFVDLHVFIHAHRESLKSLTLPIDREYTSRNLKWVLQAFTGLPVLKSLSFCARFPSCSSRSYGYLNELTSALVTSNPLLERFSMTSIGATFSASMGGLFRPFNNLKILALGDGDNQDGPFAADGRIDFNAYKLIPFIRELPPSLEELYLTIHGDDLILDEDEDFDPIWEIGPDIFKTLRRLHTCDIIAWLSDIDGGIGMYPEKAVHWRRLRHVVQDGPSSPPPNNIKDVLELRMDSIYQEDEPLISHCTLTVELDDDEGIFEGKDSEDAWFVGNPGIHEPTDFVPISGEESGEESREGTPIDIFKVSWIWQWRRDLVRKYPMYHQYQVE